MKTLDMESVDITNEEFNLFRTLIYEISGINLSVEKKILVRSRLAPRLKHYKMSSYYEYYKYIKGDLGGELQVSVDLLTTNETYFFREPKHFDFLCEKVLPQQRGAQLRYWSAASSSGEEAYSLAMTLAEYGRSYDWNVTGTDISTRVVERAKKGHYPLNRLQDMPTELLHKYCLKGVGSQEGTFVITPELRRNVNFIHANLKHDQSALGDFDVIFLRNVLIYFDLKTKQQIVAGILRRLKPKGYLMISHSENLHGVTDKVVPLQPSVYQKK